MTHTRTALWIAALFLVCSCPVAAQDPVLASSATVGAGCGGSSVQQPQLISGRPVIGETVVAHIAYASPGATAYVAYSLPPVASFDLGSGCTAYVDVFNFTLSAPFTIGVDGTALLVTPVSVPPSWAGAELRLQVVAYPDLLDLGTVELTNGIHWVLGS